MIFRWVHLWEFSSFPLCCIYLQSLGFHWFLFLFWSGMLAVAALVLGVGVLVWAYQAVTPPPPKICGSPNGPPVTSPRIKLSDGRYLAYKERGVPKEQAKYKVILVHGFDSSKDIYLPLSQVHLYAHLSVSFSCA